MYSVYSSSSSSSRRLQSRPQVRSRLALSRSSAVHPNSADAPSPTGNKWPWLETTTNCFSFAFNISHNTNSTASPPLATALCRLSPPSLSRFPLSSPSGRTGARCFRVRPSGNPPSHRQLRCLRGRRLVIHSHKQRFPHQPILHRIPRQRATSNDCSLLSIRTALPGHWSTSIRSPFNGRPQSMCALTTPPEKKVLSHIHTHIPPSRPTEQRAAVPAASG